MYPQILKQKSVFLFGFGVGFLFTVLISFIGDFLYAVAYDKPMQYEQYHLQRNYFNKLRLPPKNISYNRWLRSEKFQKYDIDMDKYFYGPKNYNFEETILESDWLKTKVHITCVAFVEKLEVAKAIEATWGTRCDKLYFFGRRFQNFKVAPIVNIDVKITSSWQLLCEAMNFIKEKQELLEWIIFTKDDTVVIPENLRHFVAPFDHRTDHYLGHPIVMWGRAYNLAQSAYVLSEGAFNKITALFNTSEKCATGGKYWKKEDYYLGKHLASLNIYPSDTRDQYLRSTFHSYSLQQLLWGIGKIGNYWTHALYPPTTKSCCSPTTIAFSAGESSKMYTLNYLLYHLHFYKCNAVFGNLPAATSIPETEVWKIALKEEFNMSYTTDISADKYYELWRSKYSEPAEFIERHFGNVLHGSKERNNMSDKSIKKNQSL